jgi:hypothetical protein
MYGKAVKIGDQEIWVWCSPNTPLSEILQRAARTAAKEEEDRNRADPVRVMYRDAILNPSN